MRVTTGAVGGPVGENTMKGREHEGYAVTTTETQLVIAGHAVLFGDLLDPDVLNELRRVGQSPDNRWGVLFVYERDASGNRVKSTLYTADTAYVESLTDPSGSPITEEALAQRFPAFQPGWVIADSGTS